VTEFWNPTGIDDFTGDQSMYSICGKAAHADEDTNCSDQLTFDLAPELIDRRGGKGPLGPLGLKQYDPTSVDERTVNLFADWPESDARFHSSFSQHSVENLLEISTPPTPLFRRCGCWELITAPEQIGPAVAHIVCVSAVRHDQELDARRPQPSTRSPI